MSLTQLVTTLALKIECSDELKCKATGRPEELILIERRCSVNRSASGEPAINHTSQPSAAYELSFDTSLAMVGRNGCKQLYA